MEMRIYAVLVLLALLSPLAAQNPEGKRPELASLYQARRKMTEALDHLPDITCLALIDRSVRLPSKRRPVISDRIRLEVAFIGLTEMFAWPGSTKFEYSSWGEMVETGASGFGSFASGLHSILRSAGVRFDYSGERNLAGRPSFRFDFQVPVLESEYLVNIRGRQAKVPYSGSLWVDRDTQDVQRLEVRAEPVGLPFLSVGDATDYARMGIGFEDFLFPARAEQIIVDSDGNEYRNVTRFDNCRQYTVESSVSFHAPDEQVQQPKRQGNEVELPAGVDLEVRLESAISFEDSAVGDLVTARIDRPVQAQGIVLSKGTILTGRIRRLEQVSQPELHFVVGLEFDFLDSGDARVRLNARLVGPPLKVWEVLPRGLDIDNSEPRFGVFRVHSAHLNLRKGFKMIWRTQSAPRASSVH